MYQIEDMVEIILEKIYKEIWDNEKEIVKFEKNEDNKYYFGYLKGRNDACNYILQVIECWFKPLFDEYSTKILKEKELKERWKRLTKQEL